MFIGRKEELKILRNIFSRKTFEIGIIHGRRRVGKTTLICESIKGYKVEHTFLKEVDALALANRQLNLERAFKTFFSKQTSFPNFQSRKNDYGYTTNLVNGHITLLDSI